jgi:hypothetical protein
MNQVYSYLLTNMNFKGNEVRASKVAQELGMTERDLRYQTAEIQKGNGNFKINFNNEGIYLCGIEELKQLRTRSINAIRREVEKIKEFDRILNLENQLRMNYDLIDLEIKKYGNIG